jgi:hypothetical protein
MPTQEDTQFRMACLQWRRSHGIAYRKRSCSYRALIQYTVTQTLFYFKHKAAQGGINTAQYNTGIGINTRIIPICVDKYPRTTYEYSTGTMYILYMRVLYSKQLYRIIAYSTV